MATKDRLRKSILKKINELSEEKLPKVESYLNELETEFSTDQTTLSFSGIFKDLDLDETTINLHESRRDSQDRIPEF